MYLSEVQVFEIPWRWHRGDETYGSEHYIRRKYCDIYYALVGCNKTKNI
jgi:hypothetical protein